MSKAQGLNLVFVKQGLVAAANKPKRQNQAKTPGPVSGVNICKQHF